MSLSVGTSGSALISQLLASIYQTNNNQQSTPANSNSTAANTSTDSSNALTGNVKPSFSDDVLSTLMQMQQDQRSSNFIDPAKTRVENNQPAATSTSDADSVALAHNNKMAAIRPDLTSGNIAVSTTSDGDAAAATDTGDATDASDTLETSSIGFQTTSRAAFGN